MDLSNAFRKKIKNKKIYVLFLTAQEYYNLKPL